MAGAAVHLAVILKPEFRKAYRTLSGWRLEPWLVVYSIFDMMNLIHAAGLRGAGDTVYPMALTFVLAWIAMLVPAWVGCVVLGAGAYFAWTTASLYVLLLGLLMRRRFRAGHWKSMRVIEPAPLTA